MRRVPILPILLIATCLLGLVTACTESGSLPTEPVHPAPASEWSVVYPILVNTDLRAAWGLDADDMWAVGRDGVILHFDGERCTRMASPTNAYLADIHGRARDDVWAVGGSEVLHWDGIRWSVAWTDPAYDNFTAVWCADDGDVFVGGELHHGGSWFGAVLRHDGARWWNTSLPRLEHRRPDPIWQPRPGGPLLMAIDQGLYRLGNSRWTLTDAQLVVWDADGAVAIGRMPERDVAQLFRFTDAGEPFTPCPDETLSSGFSPPYRVADTREPTLRFSNHVAVHKDDCRLEVMSGEPDGYLHDLDAPELLRPTGAVLFGVGSSGLFTRGVRIGDRAFVWEPLVPGPTVRARGAITGTADLVFVGSASNEILVREGATWRLENHEDIPFEPELRLLPDGRLIAWRPGQPIVVRRTDATWHTLPPPPDGLRHVWTDGDDEALGYTPTGVEWTLADGHWARTDSVPDGVRALAGRGRDEIYRLTVPGVLERRDDAGWQHVLGDDVDWVRGIYLSPWSDDVWVSLGGPTHGSITAFLRDGNPALLFGSQGRTWDSDRVCEVSPGELYLSSSRELHRLTGDGWQEVPLRDPDRPLDHFWGHPDQGLFVLDWDGNLAHRPLPGSGEP